MWKQKPQSFYTHMKSVCTIRLCMDTFIITKINNVIQESNSMPDSRAERHMYVYSRILGWSPSSQQQHQRQSEKKYINQTPYGKSIRK